MGLFGGHAYDGVSVDDLVSHLGVHRNSLYKALGSKRGLYLIALRHQPPTSALCWTPSPTQRTLRPRCGSSRRPTSTCFCSRRSNAHRSARAIAVQIANATFAARSAELWGQGSTAVASDSTHVHAYDQNLFTE